MPGMKTGLWLRIFPYTISEIFLFHSTITVCHTILYHTRCLTAQDQDGKFVGVMMRVTAYNIHPNFHLVYTVFINISKLSFSAPHILQSVTINGNKNLKKDTYCCITDRCTEEWTLSIGHVLEMVSKICYSEIIYAECMCQFNRPSYI